MDLKLNGHTTVVLGGASGIGFAIAQAFAREKSSVVLLDLSSATSQKAEEIACKFQVTVTGETLDVTDYAAVLKSAAVIKSKFGRIDHIVYAAGVGSGKLGFPFWNVEPADWPRVLQVNLIGAVNTAHAFAPLLIEQADATILFVSSIAGQIGSQTDPPYSAAKAGLINFAMCAAKDFAQYNVRVNTVCPGMIQTPLNKSVWKAWNDRQSVEDRMEYEAWGESKVKQVAPLGRWQESEEIAGLAVYLASPLACNITGQTLNVDGGQVMHW